MFKAIDSYGTTIDASDATKTEKYYCPICGSKLTLKQGKKRIPHFAHESTCSYIPDKDYMSEWHIRMQNYFPKDSREYYFKDPITTEIHRADVFLKENNVVIEFQKSRISTDEFMSRTAFHNSEGRKIVWIFDESKESSRPGDDGKLRRDYDGLYAMEYPHDSLSYKWLYHRTCFAEKMLDFLEENRLDVLPNFAIYIYTGKGEGDIIRRIICEHLGFEYVTLSIQSIRLYAGMNPEDLFRDEEYWIENSEIAESVHKYRMDKVIREEIRKQEREAKERKQKQELFNRMMPKRRGWHF